MQRPRGKESEEPGCGGRTGSPKVKRGQREALLELSTHGQQDPWEACPSLMGQGPQVPVLLTDPVTPAALQL